MEVHGAALRAFFEGETGEEEIVRTDAGRATPVPVRHFFHTPPEFRALVNAALARCAGRVLGAGAGSGLHAVALEEMGLAVTAVDISTQAVEIIRRRGVRDVHSAGILTYQGGPFDTLLMLGHGLGITERSRASTASWHMRGAWFYPAVRYWRIRSTCESQRIRNTWPTTKPTGAPGRYIGEIRIQLEYTGRTGPYFGWLHVDAETLVDHAAAHGWNCEVIAADDAGNFVARLGC